MRKGAWTAAAVGIAAIAGGTWAATQPDSRRHDLEARAEIGNVLDSPLREHMSREDEAALRARVARGEVLDVGDADTFGKPMKWLGAMSSPRFIFRTDCSRPSRFWICHPIYADSGGSASDGIYHDVARMTLPPRSMDRMLCHWQTVTINAQFFNRPDYGTRPVAVEVFPFITVESDVLNDPALVDPDYGTPLGGRLTLNMPRAAVHAQLEPGDRVQGSESSTRTCVGGILTRANLRQYWGLSEAQVKAFFDGPITLRMNVSALAHGVENGSYQVSYRFVGN